MVRLTDQLEIGGPVDIELESINLEGNLHVPTNARGIILFIHGSGSSRYSQRNQFVADRIDPKMATLLFDLLTPKETAVDAQTGLLRFDIGLLARRVVAVTNWLRKQPLTRSLPVGYFAASTGAAAALVAASQLPGQITAVVSRGGRPDLAGAALTRVTAPTLLIVGARDRTVLQFNREALAALQCEKRLAVVSRATHLFEEPGTLGVAADLASDWFGKHMFLPSSLGRRSYSTLVTEEMRI